MDSQLPAVSREKEGCGRMRTARLVLLSSPDLRAAAGQSWARG